jgi:2-keto-3-deoxy-6-phosphogluconate aldolase
MAISSGRVTVGTERVQIPVASNMPFKVALKNDDNTDAVFIGNGTVTTSNGLRLAKEGQLSFDMTPGDQLFAVSSKEGHTISFLLFTRGKA